MRKSFLPPLSTLSVFGARRRGATSERQTRTPRYLAMDIGFTVAILLIVFFIATAIGFAWTGFSCGSATRVQLWKHFLPFSA